MEAKFLKTPKSERQQLALFKKMDSISLSSGTSTNSESDCIHSSPLSLQSPTRTPLHDLNSTTPLRRAMKRNYKGETPLHIASMRGQTSLVKKLLNEGVDPNIHDYANWTPLHEACNRGHTSVVTALLEHGARVNEEGMGKESPLHDAARNGHFSVVRELVRFGADKLAVNSNGKTPLDEAIDPRNRCTNPDLQKTVRFLQYNTDSDDEFSSDADETPTSDLGISILSPSFKEIEVCDKSSITPEFKLLPDCNLNLFSSTSRNRGRKLDLNIDDTLSLPSLVCSDEHNYSCELKLNMCDQEILPFRELPEIQPKFAKVAKYDPYPPDISDLPRIRASYSYSENVTIVTQTGQSWKVSHANDLRIDVPINVVKPMKRFVNKKKDYVRANIDDICPVQSDLEGYNQIRQLIEQRRRGMFVVRPKPPHGYDNYLMHRKTNLLQQSVAYRRSLLPTRSPPPLGTAQARELFVQQEEKRKDLCIQHLIEKEKLVLAVEQEILRVHCRAACELAHQRIPLSVCSVLAEEDIYSLHNALKYADDSYQSDQIRSSFNSRKFFSSLYEIDQKWDRIKEQMLSRHRMEADSLYAYQKLAMAQELMVNANDEPTTMEGGDLMGNVPFSFDIVNDEMVPLVKISDNFDVSY